MCGGTCSQGDRPSRRPLPGRANPAQGPGQEADHGRRQTVVRRISICPSCACDQHRRYDRLTPCWEAKPPSALIGIGVKLLLRYLLAVSEPCRPAHGLADQKVPVPASTTAPPEPWNPAPTRRDSRAVALPVISPTRFRESLGPAAEVRFLLPAPARARAANTRRAARLLPVARQADVEGRPLSAHPLPAMDVRPGTRHVPSLP